MDNVLAAAPRVQRRQAEATLLSCGFAVEDLNKPASALSGGMSRRTALVRALLAPHDLLLLDEPFKGLDAETRDKVIAVIRQMPDQTVLMTTHQMEEAQLMDAVIVTPKELEP